jgi:unsaturated chondroitin disaccharide hydrolase
MRSSTIDEHDAATLTRADIERALDTAGRSVTRLVTDHPDRVPVYTNSGRWVFDADPWAPVWTAGFLTGQLWIAAERTGDPWLRDAAEHYSLMLEHRKSDTKTHDIGFILDPSWGRWHDIAPSDHTRDVLIQGGRTMAGRFNDHGQYLSTWVDDGSTFIDVMMNIGVIFRAAALSGDAHLAEVATNHALTSRRYLVRGDASTVHEGWFDPRSGEFLRAATHQGYRADSCWARGQAWGIYGFGTAYRYTKDRRFLQTAQALAEFYMAKTGQAYVPPNDWDDPRPVLPYESSAACGAASAFLQLAELLAESSESGETPGGSSSQMDEDDARRYARYGAGIVSTLSGPRFLAAADDEWEGVIKHAMYHRRHGLGVDESVMWGDYYFVEALWRLHASEHLRRLAGIAQVSQ